MGRPPSSGGPVFRFTQAEVAEMEALLKQLNNAIPHFTVIQPLADKFTAVRARTGQIAVQPKQVCNWFQNRKYSYRFRAARGAPTSAGPKEQHAGSVRARAPSASAPAGSASGKNSLEGGQHIEFEAKSARDGAWYDVAAFLSHRFFETGDPEVQVRFSGFGVEDDEWINIRKCLRQRSLPCEAMECVAVLPGDIILCFKESKEEALYFDARVLDAQRRRHDVRGCRCRFLIRYDHDHSEEIVPLRKMCRRPETSYRLQISHAARAAASADVQTLPKEVMVRSAPIGKSSVEQKPPKQHEMIDVNTVKVTMVSNPDQEELTTKAAAALPAAPHETRNDSCSDVPMGMRRLIRKLKVEVTDEAQEGKTKEEEYFGFPVHCV